VLVELECRADALQSERLDQEDTGESEPVPCGAEPALSASAGPPTVLSPGLRRPGCAGVAYNMRNRPSLGQ